MIMNHVRPCAATDHTDVARRSAKESVFGPMTTANIVEDIKQFFDRRLARFRIRRMCRASFSRDEHPDRSLRSGCQPTISRLAIYQELTLARQRMLVCRLSTMTAELFINREEQSNII